MKKFIESEIADLASLLRENSPLVKEELGRHLKVVEMHPNREANDWYYVAQGAWNLLGTDEKAPREEHSAQNSTKGRFRMVAGAGFEPATFGL